MIVSMKPPYEITTTILRLITVVSEKLGEVKASFLNKPSHRLRMGLFEKAGDKRNTMYRLRK